MIDARDEVLSTTPAQAHRRAGAKSSRPSSRSAAAASKKALKIERLFSDPNVKPFDQIDWETRTAEITDESGKVIFKQENVEVPKSWSVLAMKVAVSQY